MAKPIPFGLGRVPLIPPLTPAPKPPEVSILHNPCQNIPPSSHNDWFRHTIQGWPIIVLTWIFVSAHRKDVLSSNSVHCKDNQNLGLSVGLLLPPLEEILAVVENNTAKSQSNKWRVESGGTMGKGTENPSPKNI